MLSALAAAPEHELTAVTLLAPDGAATAPALREPGLAAAAAGAHVAVLDAAMVSLDRYAHARQLVLSRASCGWERHQCAYCGYRDAREVVLDTGGRVAYDILVLAPGLANTTLAAVAASPAGVAGVAGVCSPAELATLFSAGDAAAVASSGTIVVYGDTLDAADALATLAARGVDTSASVLHIAPAGQAVPPDVLYMRQARAFLLASPACPAWVLYSR
jgi:hypothetical protein